VEIHSSGSYVLTDGVTMTSGDIAIQISSPNVPLDLYGQTIAAEDEDLLDWSDSSMSFTGLFFDASPSPNNLPTTLDLASVEATTGQVPVEPSFFEVE